MWKGFPYYPYVRDPSAKHGYKVVDYVSPHQKPVDEVIAQHLLCNRGKPTTHYKRSVAPTKGQKRDFVESFMQ